MEKNPKLINVGPTFIPESRVHKQKKIFMSFNKQLKPLLHLHKRFEKSIFAEICYLIASVWLLVYLPSIPSHFYSWIINFEIGRTEVFGMSDDEEASKRCWATLSDFEAALLSTESMQCSTYSGVVMSWICLKGHVKTKEYIDIASTPISNNNFILSELLTDVLRIFSLFKSFQLFGVAVQFWEQHQKVKKTSEIKRSFNNKQGQFCYFITNGLWCFNITYCLHISSWSVVCFWTYRKTK